uniref:IPT/TIG domain-containing protein n=1 Tax=Solibacter usitatus (strain Ellin6076) TaxID=234267 RepID=Q01YV0_SOLUE
MTPASAIAGLCALLWLGSAAFSQNPKPKTPGPATETTDITTLPPANPAPGPSRGRHTEKDNGIYVDIPKIYDDASLAALFQAAQGNLLKLNAFDSSTLLKGIGATQGASAQQSLAAAQLNTIRLPGSSTTAVTPTIPGTPATTGFTLPSAFSPSATDLLNEQTQLNAQITNLQLLLEGALSDQFVPGKSLPKQRVTFGFPISINVPMGYQYQHAVAEVEISVCGPNITGTDTPSIVALLPQAKTYNVASIVNKSTALSGGAIAGIMNFGGSFLHGHQTYYLVQDQDTIALQRPSHHDCRLPGDKSYDARTFAWQFKPVLGQPVVRDGLRQTFVQIAFPQRPNNPDQQGACGDYISIDTVWRAYDPKTGRVAAPIGEPIHQHFQPAPYYLGPKPINVRADDNGDGTLTVRAIGGFKTGTYVRIGKTVIDGSAATPASAGFEQTTWYIKFNATASDLLLKGARLVNRDGTEADILVGQPDGETTCPKPPPVEADRKARTIARTEKGGKSSPPPPATAEQLQQQQAGQKPLSKSLYVEQLMAPANEISATLRRAVAEAGKPEVTLVPFSDSLTLVKIPHAAKSKPSSTNPADDQPSNIPVVLIGAKVFGLRDAPFREVTAEYLTILASNDLLSTNRQLVWTKLFTSDPGEVYQIPHRDELSPSSTAGAQAQASGFSVNPIKFLATDPATHLHRYALSGIDLGPVSFLVPAISSWVVDSSTLKVFSLTDDQVKALKRIVIRHAGDPPLVLDLPAENPPAPPKFSLDAQAANPSGPTLTVKGYGLDQIVSIRYLDTPLSFTPAQADPDPASSKKVLTVNLPGPLNPPGINLTFFLTDKTLYEYAVPVK